MVGDWSRAMILYELLSYVYSMCWFVLHLQSSKAFQNYMDAFYARTAQMTRFCHATACNATHSIAVTILSICPSVHPSVRCVYCDKTKWCTADILIPHEVAITLVFWHHHWLVGDAPFLSNIRRKWPTFFVKHRLCHLSLIHIWRCRRRG